MEIQQLAEEVDEEEVKEEEENGDKEKKGEKKKGRIMRSMKLRLGERGERGKVGCVRT